MSFQTIWKVGAHRGALSRLGVLRLGVIGRQDNFLTLKEVLGGHAVGRQTWIVFGVGTPLLKLTVERVPYVG